MKLRNYLQQRITLSPEEWKVFEGMLIKESYPKKFPLLKKGSIEEYVSFIEKGIVRFYVPGEELDTSFAFIFEEEFLCAYDSFLLQQPCRYAAETVTETTIWRLSYHDLQTLYEDYPQFNILGRILSEQIYLKKADRELAFLTQTPEERYTALFSQRPNVMKFIPLQYIATYIGITPQALSRIRKRIS
ncbi:CRP-like cAMP-binding protein [Chitinophaga dinghuensis]|uniref:CRP-like cAMP-binding protein n=1 Tax=Chitinophaga dinghuensis TaxID=1539050 RepID=A0A327VNJ5_9BACT|nr:Crp/Fnr family transcriptional regulator [Chitinophaga dinghuensis]RAJ76663.1 CRP-like cAMP-binding protein [Chitinophaga dinghuensis]